MKNKQTPQLCTVGVIARGLGVSISRVQYVIRTRKIRPRATAGPYNVYGDDEVSWIRIELGKIRKKCLTSTPSPPACPTRH